METQTHATTSTRYAIRPFRIDIPEEAIADLRRRITATVWPDKETVADDFAGCATGNATETRAPLGAPTTTSGGSRQN